MFVINRFGLFFFVFLDLLGQVLSILLIILNRLLIFGDRIIQIFFALGYGIQFLLPGIAFINNW